MRLYAQYTDPKSEEGSKLSPEEKERLLDLFLNELRIIIDQFGRRILIRVGGFIRKVFNKLFGLLQNNRNAKRAALLIQICPFYRNRLKF